MPAHPGCALLEVLKHSPKACPRLLFGFLAQLQEMYRVASDLFVKVCKVALAFVRMGASGDTLS